MISQLEPLMVSGIKSVLSPYGSQELVQGVSTRLSCSSRGLRIQSFILFLFLLQPQQPSPFTVFISHCYYQVTALNNDAKDTNCVCDTVTLEKTEYLPTSNYGQSLKLIVGGEF